MRYTAKVLQPGEELQYETGLHWLAYLPAYLILGLAAIIAIVTAWLDPSFKQYLFIVAGVVAIIGVIFALAAAWRRAGTELAVTNHRVIYKRGLVSRHTIEISRSKVESVDVDQSLWGRILGFGTVIVRGTGGSLEPFPQINHP